MDSTLPKIKFKDYLFKNRRNKTTIWVVAAALVLQFAIFKYFYPYASYIHGDSFVYLQTAYDNLRINTYMIGYSMFLRLFSVFLISDTALVTFQYLLLQGSALFFLFTMDYFYRPGKAMRTILLCFMVFNPLFLFMGNMVSSDAFFLSLSLIWFTLLLWIMHQPSAKLIIWHTLIIYIAFTVRYNAMIYLFISVVAFILSPQSAKRKILGITGAVIVIGLFVIYTGNRYKILTGAWQYSPFAGWQMANNAMYAYRYVDSAHRKEVPEKFRQLDKMVRTYFDSTHDIRKNPQEALMASTVYMWDPSSPLYKYRDGLFKNDSIATELKKWASMGPFYKEYGWYIIRQYPLQYAQYFIWPSASKYYAPPVEFLDSYNAGKDSVAQIAMTWFRYDSQRVTTRTKSMTITILDFYPILSGTVNIVMLFSLLCFLSLGGFRQNDRFRNFIFLIATVWIFNAAFTIFASSAALRFQSFPILLTTSSVALLVDWLWKMASSSEVQGSKQEITSQQKEAIIL